MAKKRVHRSGGSRPADSLQPQRPARRTPPSTPTGARARFEAASRPVLVRMRALPTFLIPMLMAVLMFVALAVRQPWAGALLIVVSAFLAWLTALSWPAITTGSRVLRVVVDLAILALGVLKLLGRI